MRTPSQEEVKILKSFAKRIDPNDPAAHNNLAVVYFNRGLFDEAIRELKKALDLDPDFNLARINLEIILKKTKKKEDLIESYARKVEINPEDVNTRLEYAKTLYQLAKYPDALREYREVLLRDAKNKEALKGIIRCYKKMGKFQEAIAAIRRAQRIYPDELDLKLDLGEVLYNQGNYDSAIKVLKEVIEKQPNNAKAHLFLSFALGEKGYLEEALEEAIKAKELDPRISRIQGALGIDEEEVPSIEEMLQESIGVKEIKTDPYESKLNLFIAYKNKLFLKEAKSLLGDLKKLRPDSSEVRKFEAEILILEEKWEDVVKLIESIKEKDFHTWNMYGVALSRLGEKDKAMKIFEGIRNYPYALNNLACLNVNNEKDKAKEMFLKAYETEPGFIVPLYNLSLIEMENKNFEKALYYIKEINEVEKENPFYLTLYGKILIETGEENKAKEMLREALRVAPDFSYAAYLLSNLEEKNIDIEKSDKRAFVFQYLFAIEGSPKPIESRIFPEKEILEFEGDKEKEIKKVRILLRKKNFEEAEKILLSLIRKFPEDKEILYLLALTYENLGFFENAESYFLKLLKEKPDDKIRFHLAHIYFRTKRYDKAEEEIMKILKKGKEYVDVLLLLARIKERKGEINEALFALRRVLKKSKPNKRILLWFSELLEKLERYEEALKEYENLIKKYPTDGEIIYAYGRASLRAKKEEEFKKSMGLLEKMNFKSYLNLLRGIDYTAKGKYKEAIQILKECEKEMYLKEELHFYLGVSYALIGKYAKAIEEWSKVIKISENSPLANKAREYTSLALKWLKMLEKEVRI